MLTFEGNYRDYATSDNQKTIILSNPDNIIGYKKIVRMIETDSDVYIIPKESMLEINKELYFLQKYYKDTRLNAE